MNACINKLAKSTLIALMLMSAACNKSGGGGGANNEEETTTNWDALLAARVVDYSAALRDASMRLLGRPPTLAEIKSVADAPDKKTAYESALAAYLGDIRFADQMFRFWQNTLRMGGTKTTEGGAMLSLDTAPAFAAQLVVEGRPLTELFTAANGTCPTFTPASGTFTAANCDNGVTTHAGILTNPGVQSHYYGNLAFRRVRWLQEVFVCKRLPVETSGPAQDVGGAEQYLSPWPFTSISGSRNNPNVRVDFHDVSSVVCANCHSTLNHIAPLFGRFNIDGVLGANYAVELPVDGTPAAMLSDWLPDGESTAWRFGKPVATINELGNLMAQDREVIECIVARAWNFAMGKGDIVANLTTVPATITGPLADAFVASNYNYKTLLSSIFSGDDFVRY